MTASSILTFPLEPLGDFLRNMSLSGTAGNITASLIYGCISLIPIAAWFILQKKGKMIKADYLLFLLSVVLFYVLYYSINPGLFQTQITGSGGIYLSGIFYSALVTYGVIRIQNMAMKGSRKTIQILLKAFLWLLVILFGSMVALEFIVSLPAAMKEASVSYEQAVFFDSMAAFPVSASQEVIYVFTVMESVMKAVPYILDIVIIFKAMTLVKELQKDWYSKESVQAAGTLSEVTGRTLVLVSVLGFAYNVIQLLGRNSVLNSKMTINVPVLSIVFLLAVLLLARYIKASQELKEENEMFI